MLLAISPAKSLALDRSAPQLSLTEPHFVADAERLVKVLSKKRAHHLQDLMGISEPLATLNAQRFRDWAPNHGPANSHAAILAFDGDVYQGLDAPSLTESQLLWANAHLVTLSGLYGVLRPLDWMQAYRLEMGTALKVGKANNLYAYWGSKIAKRMDEMLGASGSPEVVNLASQEYFKAVDQKALRAPVIECVFEEGKDGQFKVLGFFAKRARGLMVRYAIDNQIDQSEGLKAFDSAGYRYSAAASSANRWVFRRVQPPPVATTR